MQWGTHRTFIPGVVNSPETLCPVCGISGRMGLFFAGKPAAVRVLLLFLADQILPLASIHHIYQPSPALQPFVKCYLEIHMGSAGEMLGCALPAKLEQCIFFSTGPVPLIESPGNGNSNILSEERCCYIRGSVNNARLQLHIHGVLAMFVVIFHPTGFFRLFGIPASHFTDTFTHGDLSLGKDWEILGTDIRNTATMQEKVLLADSYLLHQLSRKAVTPDAVDIITEQLLRDPDMPVYRMAKESYLSERQFRRKFTERTGISPQTFSRISRGNNALKMKQLFPQRSWRSILLETGYSDASHFRREMKVLMGIEQPGLQGNDRFINVKDTHFKLLEKRRLQEEL